MLRLYGAPQGRLAAAVARFAPQWRAEAQWKCRGAETLLAVHADTPSGLKKAAQSLRSSFGADVYGAGDTSLAVAAVQALEAHDRLLACGDAAAGALLEARRKTDIKHKEAASRRRVGRRPRFSTAQKTAAKGRIPNAAGHLC